MGKSGSKSKRSASMPDAFRLLQNKNLLNENFQDEHNIDLFTKTPRKNLIRKTQKTFDPNEYYVSEKFKGAFIRSSSIEQVENTKSKLEDKQSLLELKNDHFNKLLLRNKGDKDSSKDFISKKGKINIPVNTARNADGIAHNILYERKKIADLKSPLEEEIISPRLFCTLTSKKASLSERDKNTKHHQPTSALERKSNTKETFQNKRTLSNDDEAKKKEPAPNGFNINNNDAYQFRRNLLGKRNSLINNKDLKLKQLNIKAVAELKGKGIRKIEIIDETNPRNNESDHTLLEYLLTNRISPTDYFIKGGNLKSKFSTNPKNKSNENPKERPCSSIKEKDLKLNSERREKISRILFPEDQSNQFFSHLKHSKASLNVEEPPQLLKRRGNTILLNINPVRDLAPEEVRSLFNESQSIKRKLNLKKNN